MLNTSYSQTVLREGDGWIEVLDDMCVQEARAGYRCPMRDFKQAVNDETALSAPWSEHDYLRWQREQDERDEQVREAMNLRVLERFDPECEAAVRALEESKWGSIRPIDRR